MPVRTRTLLLLATAGIAAAVWSGYCAEHRAMSAAGAPKTNVRTMVKRLVTPKAKRAGVDRLEELRQTISRSHPTFEEIRELWSVVRAFSLEEVQTALEALPVETSRPVNEGIADMLYYRWAQLDPEAAAKAAVADGGKGRRFAPYTVISAWAQRDPEAAIRWGRESGHPMARSAAMQLAALQWVTADPATALSRAKAEFPDATQSVIRRLADKLSATPESRRQLFTMIAGEISGVEEREFLSRLAWQLREFDAAGVDELAGEMTASGWADERVQAFREGASRYHSTFNARDALEKPSPGDPAASDVGRRTTFAVWSMNEPESAIQWAEARSETDLISQNVHNFAEKLLESDWSPGRQMDTPWAETVRRHFAAWQRMDAQAADTWLATMPADLRKLVTTPPRDAAR